MLHTFICDVCGLGIQDTSTKGVHVCPKCGAEMRWDLGGIGIRPGGYNHVSDSLAFHPDDIPDHRRMFPGIEVTPDGRPMFTSPKQQERYANACGFDKKSQRIRQRGRRIA